MSNTGELTYNLTDALRMDSLALQLVPGELVTALMENVGLPGHAHGARPTVAILIQRGNMTMSMGGHVGNIPVETGSVWSLPQLAHLYAMIEHVTADLGDDDRQRWTTAVELGRRTAAELPGTAQRLTPEQHEQLHHHAPEAPARPEGDERTGLYL